MLNYLYIIGNYPIIVYKFDNLEFSKRLQQYTDAPISRHLLLEILKEYKRPNDKISEWIKSGELILLKRGMYVPGPTSKLPMPGFFLIANQLRGPSYVSLESALSYWGCIPERTYEVSSVTVKPSKRYKTPIGRFDYQKLPTPYYSYGIRRVQLKANQFALIASPEKALCDKIILTAGINLRSIRQAKDFLLDDLRMEEQVFPTLDREMISSWIEDAPKKNSLQMLVSTLKEI
jgi:hypothetical protein